MKSLPQKARVVIIGGGVVGCSILYHLAKKGWQDCVLLERRELSCGSSWHAAGQFHIINSNANLSELQLHTLKFYPELQAESEQDIGLHRTGGLYFASTPERLDYLKQERGKNRQSNPDMEFIDLAQAKQMHPLIDEKCFLGALYDPLDGYIDPASVVQAYAKAAKKRGGQIYQQTMVTALSQFSNGSWRVQTEHGEIDCDFVVNAAGLWAREVGQMAGLKLPLMAMEHHYLITETLSEIAALDHELPSMVDFDGNAYGRQEGQGMLLGTYEENGCAWSLDQTPWDFGHELLPNQLERIASRLEMAYSHFPRLASAGIKKTVNGPFTFAPDGNALIGPIPQCRNYWLACGVMAGYCQGAGIGQVFAEWMVEGEPGMDIFAMDAARFGDFASHRYTHQKVIENFGRRFQISYPNEELPAMRPWRTTALYDRLKSQGAVFGAAFGLEHALWFAPCMEEAKEEPSFRRSNAFSHVAKEVETVRNGVGLIEIANFAKYEISGAEAEVYLDTLLAAALPAIGRTRLAPMLSARGRLLGDLSVSRLEDQRFFMMGSGAAQVAHMRYFQTHLTPHVKLSNLSHQLHGIAIAGPKSRDLLAQLTRTNVSREAFPFMHVQEMEVGGVSAIVIRVSFTGELGYEIYCPPEYQLALYEALMSAGKPLGLCHFGARALMSMRLEKSFGAWTLDFREDFTPKEAGLDIFLDPDKSTDFIGQDALNNPLYQGRRRRVTLALNTKDIDAYGDEPVLLNNQPVGFVTSGGFGHFVKQSLAIAYLDAALAHSQETFEVEILGERVGATIQAQAAYDPKGEKMRS